MLFNLHLYLFDFRTPCCLHFLAMYFYWQEEKNCVAAAAAAAASCNFKYARNRCSYLETIVGQLSSDTISSQQQILCNGSRQTPSIVRRSCMSSIETMASSTLCSVDVNTLSIHDPSEATPQPRFKRKQEVDDYTPRSRHIDKRALPMSFPASIQPRTQDSVFHIEEPAFDASASVGSVMSQPDSPVSVHIHGSSGDSIDAPDPDVTYFDVAQTPKGSAGHSLASGEVSPVHTPRAREFQVPLKTPLVNSTIRSITNATISRHAGKTPTLTFTEADLMSFQTPAPSSIGAGKSRLQRFKDEDGQEMLLDMTPRVYSPRSVPIYTLQDIDEIKAQFEQARKELEVRVESLHLELAASISHSNHHKALAAQGDSLHSEYSKKHVRKVTALKGEWEKKTLDRLNAKDEVIAERDATIASLRAALDQEREEKREVIVMAEAVLALQGQQTETS